MTEKGLLRPKLSRNDNLIEHLSWVITIITERSTPWDITVYCSTNVLSTRVYEFLRFLMLELRGRSLEPWAIGWRIKKELYKRTKGRQREWVGHTEIFEWDPAPALEIRLCSGYNLTSDQTVSFESAGGARYRGAFINPHIKGKKSASSASFFIIDADLCRSSGLDLIAIVPDELLYTFLVK